MPNIRVLELFNDVSSEQGFAAGISVAIGDYVVLYDFNTDKLDAIHKSLQIMKSDEGTYVAGRYLHSSSFSFLARQVIYKITLKLSNLNFSSRSTSMRVISRNLVNILLAHSTNNQHLMAKIDRCGFRVSYVDYEGRYDFKEFTYYIKNFFNFVLGNSKVFFRLFAISGAFFSLVSLLIGLYSIVIKILSNEVVPGWASTICIVTFLFSIQFLMFAFWGELIARYIASNSSNSHNNIVGEKSSKKRIYQNQLNITESGTT